MEPVPDTAIVVGTRSPALRMRDRLRGLFPRRRFVLYLTVVVPTMLAIAYFGIIASDVYVSESRFLVRSPKQQMQLGTVETILQGAGLARAQDDTYSVQSYILSRDALRELDEKLGVRKAFSNHDIDIFDRFNPLGLNDSLEKLYLYYQKHVTVDYDASTSISSLTVRAYTAEDARKINDTLLRMAERLINRLNERSHEDLIAVAAHEVQLAEERATAATLALSSFRNKQNLFEPNKQSELQLEGVAKLQADLIALEAQISQVRNVSPNNPGLSALVTQANTLRNAIAAETAKVAGSRGSLSSKSTDFERLVLERGFAEKQLEAANVALETARSEARRQQLYLDRLSEPVSPDYAMEPRRVRSIVTVLVIGLILWGVLSLILASIREHLD